jgi:hypothetical protein
MRLGGKVVCSLAHCYAVVLGFPGSVARAEAAELAFGDKAPVRLTSRGDYDRPRLVSSAAAYLYEYWRRKGRARCDEPGVAKAAE